MTSALNRWPAIAAMLMAALAGCADQSSASQSSVEPLNGRAYTIAGEGGKNRALAKYDYETTGDVYLTWDLGAGMSCGAIWSELVERGGAENRNAMPAALEALHNEIASGVVRAHETLHAADRPTSGTLVVTTDDGKIGVLCPSEVQYVKELTT